MQRHTFSETLLKWLCRKTSFPYLAPIMPQEHHKSLLKIKASRVSLIVPTHIVRHLLPTFVLPLTCYITKTANLNEREHHDENTVAPDLMSFTDQHPGKPHLLIVALVVLKWSTAWPTQTAYNVYETNPQQHTLYILTCKNLRLLYYNL